MPIRAWVGIGLLIAYFCLSSIYSLFALLSTPRWHATSFGDVRISEYVSRFEGVRKFLPPRGIVGYLSDTDSVAEYYLAQYAVSPVILAKGKDFRFVIGYFHGISLGDEMLEKEKLKRIKDFGNGVSLFMNLGR